MPWCEPCAKYFAPSALGEEGTCPQCGTRTDRATLSGRITAENLDLKRLAASGDGDDKAPWHFKLLVGLLVVYLVWRVVQIFV